MTDSEHLKWIHDRIVNKYNESENVDFLIRLRQITNDLGKQEEQFENYLRFVEKKQKFMDERLKDVNLLDELRETMEDVEIQLYEDEKKWGDTWKERGLIHGNQSQEERFFAKILEYVTDWRDLGVPMPWTKIMGEAHIALVREKKLKNSE